MSDDAERPLSLRQLDQARADLYAIHDELDFNKAQIARLPTRKDLARVIALPLLPVTTPPPSGLPETPPSESQP